MEQIQAPWIGHAPDDEPKVIEYCEYCDCEILEGEEYYEIHGHAICDACIHHYLRTARREL